MKFKNDKQRKAMFANIKFGKKGIKIDKNYFPVSYSKGNYTKESGLPEGTITIYSKSYKHFPKELNPENESDMRTDYFEKDRVRIKPSNKYYKEVNKNV